MKSQLLLLSGLGTKTSILDLRFCLHAVNASWHAIACKEILQLPSTVPCYQWMLMMTLAHKAHTQRSHLETHTHPRVEWPDKTQWWHDLTPPASTAVFCLECQRARKTLLMVQELKKVSDPSCGPSCGPHSSASFFFFFPSETVMTPLLLHALIDLQ